MMVVVLMIEQSIVYSVCLLPLDMLSLPPVECTSAGSVIPALYTLLFAGEACAGVDQPSSGHPPAGEAACGASSAGVAVCLATIIHLSGLVVVQQG